MKRRICFMITGFFDGGAQKQCIFLLNELSRRPDLDVSLIHFHDGVHDDLLERDGLTILKVPVASNYDPRNIARLRTVLGDLRPDILMTWLHACDVYGSILKRAVPSMRWVMTERNSHYPLDPRFVLRRLLCTRADAIIANSDKGADYWRSAGARCPLHVIGNIVPVTSVANDGPRPLRVATIGRLEAQKNAGTVIDAFGLLAARRPDLAFMVVGDGSERGGLEARAAKSGAAERIRFLGFRKDIPEQIRSAGVVVSMSHHEGLPNVMLESVAGDRLVVASDIPEHRALLGPDYPFYVGDRTDPAKVAAAIEQACADLDRTACLDHARRQIRGMTAAAIVDRYLDVFAAVLDPDSRARSAAVPATA